MFDSLSQKAPQPGLEHDFGGSFARCFQPTNFRTTLQSYRERKSKSRPPASRPCIMVDVIRTIALTCLLSSICLGASNEKRPSYPSYDYEIARAHEITLSRTGCFGRCPSYTVTVGTDGIVFAGGGYVVASGKHTDRVDANQLRNLAKRFVTADFYSMDSSYTASVTDNPAYTLSIVIDGHEKKVEDYVGSWVGMPAVITELENAVDTFAHTERWIDGSDGLVEALRGENFNFQSFEAQLMLKEAASRGSTETVRKLLKVGVPLEPLPAPKPDRPYVTSQLESVGWLNAASSHPEAVQVVINAGGSKR